MREIKFRAWDPASKGMYSVEAINFCGRKTAEVVGNNLVKGWRVESHSDEGGECGTCSGKWNLAIG